MALPSNPLTRRLGLAVAGAVVLAGGAGFAYASTLDGAVDPVVETGYAAVVDSDSTTDRATDNRDCPEKSGDTGSASPESGNPESSNSAAPSADPSQTEGSGL